jgi:diaminopimelate epimerase
LQFFYRVQAGCFCSYQRAVLISFVFNSSPLAAYNIRMSEYIHKRHNVTVLLYHLVFPAKYRRAGYTLASGSSSSAAAAVAYKLRLVDEDITVHMPGGLLEIQISEGFQVRMVGPTTRVGQMIWDGEET